MNAEQIMTKARAGLILDQPFFGAMCLKMKMIEDQSCETLWTDGASIGYNPEYVAKYSIPEIKGVLAHNIIHLVLEHHLRIQDRDASTWNKVSDYPVNKIIEESGFTLPQHALKSTEYGPMNAEAVYSEIYFKMDNSGSGPGDSNGSNGGQGSQPGQPGQSNQPGQQAPSQPKDPGGCGEVRQPPSSSGGALSQADLAQAQANNKINITQAYNIAKNIGNMPGFLQRIIEDDLLATKVRWQDVLRDFMDVAAKNDYTWTMPNPRYMQSGFYLPSLNNKEISEIVVAIDTSGSIYDEILNDFASEIKNILAAYPSITITVIYCDSEVYEDAIQTFAPTDDVILEPVGGGGTDFKPVFEYIKNHADKDPVCLVYLTDMECHWFPDKPDYPVLWVQHGNYENPPPFGEYIKIS